MTGQGGIVQRLAKGERGATAILVAGILVFLMAFAWLAIDAGLGYDDRRGTQNAADLAALAGAWEACNPADAGDHVQAALDAAAANGYVHNPGGHPLVDVSPLSPSGAVTVTITERNESIFGGAGNAPDAIDVESVATAECEEVGFLSGMAVFASVVNSQAGSACNPGLELRPGGSLTIDGRIHSNGTLTINPPSSNTVPGPATYREDPSLGNGVPIEQHFGAPIDDPVAIPISEYGVLGSRAVAAGLDYHNLSLMGTLTPSDLDGYPLLAPPSEQNSWDGSELVIRTPGIYYTSNEIDFAGATVSFEGDAGPGGQGVTFAAVDGMHLGDLGDMAGYDPVVTGGSVKLIAVSGKTSAECDPGALTAVGRDSTWEGVLYAPGGDIYLHTGGSGTTDELTILGSVIGYEISLIPFNGEALHSLTIDHQDDPTVPPEYRVELID